MATITRPPPRRKSRPVSRPRRELDPHATDVVTRFAIRLRRLIDEKHWLADDLAERLCAAGCQVSPHLVRKWLSAERFPRPEDLPYLADIFGFRDYRNILPPPL